MAQITVHIDEAEFREANRLLKAIDQKVRGEAVRASIEAAAQVVAERAKQEVPQPGYPGDKPDLKPLRDTITYDVREYPNGVVFGVVGPQYPAGAHGHLVEEGHEIWLPKPPYTKGASTESTGEHTEPDPFLERAADATTARQVQAIISTLKGAADGVVPPRTGTR